VNVHIIKDSDVSKDLYNEVCEFLLKFNGPLRFIQHEVNINLDYLSNVYDERIFESETKYTTKEIPNLSLENKTDFCFIAPSFPLRRKVLEPINILEVCTHFRIKEDIGNDEFVIFLTEKANTLNWFSYGDEHKNIFIHTSDWGFYLDCNRSFPIAHEVIGNIFRALLFRDMDDLLEHFHTDESRGCINDFCKNKKDIRLQMRTADICSDCLDLVKVRSFSLNVFNQINDIRESLRKKLMSTELFLRSLNSGRIVFKGRNRKIIFVDTGNYELKLTPLEKTVYHLFMDNEQGIRANDLYSYKKQIKELYSLFYKGNNLAQFENSINALCDYFNGSMQEKISKINAKLESALGESLSRPYKIEKDPRDDRYKISLNRNFVSYEN
jgi:hypothetical protein